jgi:hypothetical protein
MSGCRTGEQRTLELRPAVHTTVALLLATLAVAALTAAVPGAPSRLREAFAFSLEGGRGGSLVEAANYFATNARVVAALLLAAWARTRIATGALLDAPVAAMLAANVGLVGAALGAYGFRAVPWLVHLPLEWAALGATSAAYVRSRTQRLSGDATAATAGAAALLLAGAASAEAWATP